jgi:undecaprenyl pyrophosphate phosphatase UppP
MRTRNSTSDVIVAAVMGVMFGVNIIESLDQGLTTLRACMMILNVGVILFALIPWKSRRNYVPTDDELSGGSVGP